MERSEEPTDDLDTGELPVVDRAGSTPVRGARDVEPVDSRGRPAAGGPTGPAPEVAGAAPGGPAEAPTVAGPDGGAGSPRAAEDTAPARGPSPAGEAPVAVMTDPGVIEPGATARIGTDRGETDAGTVRIPGPPDAAGVAVTRGDESIHDDGTSRGARPDDAARSGAAGIGAQAAVGPGHRHDGVADDPWFGREDPAGRGDTVVIGGDAAVAPAGRPEDRTSELVGAAPAPGESRSPGDEAGAVTALIPPDPASPDAAPPWAADPVDPGGPTGTVPGVGPVAPGGPATGRPRAADPVDPGGPTVTVPGTGPDAPGGPAAGRPWAADLFADAAAPWGADDPAPGGRGAGSPWAADQIPPGSPAAAAPWSTDGGPRWRPAPGSVPPPSPPGRPREPQARPRPAGDRPRQGWRGALFAASGGLVNPGVGTAEATRLDLLRRLRAPLPGAHRVAITSIKGGVGKTSVAACLGLVLAENRGDRVIAFDAGPDAGTLADRLTGQTALTVRTLLDGVEQASSLTDVSRFTSLAGRLHVLASEQDPRAGGPLTRAEYERVCGVLTRFYNIVITDSGTGMVHPAMAGTLALADGLVVVGNPTVDSAGQALKALDWLVAHGHAGAVADAVVVLSCDRVSRDLAGLRDHLRARVRAVVEVPADPHLASGARIELPRLRPATADAFLELAALLADRFGAPARAGVPVAPGVR